MTYVNLVRNKNKKHLLNNELESVFNDDIIELVNDNNVENDKIQHKKKFNQLLDDAVLGVLPIKSAD